METSIEGVEPGAVGGGGGGGGGKEFSVLNVFGAVVLLTFWPLSKVMKRSGYSFRERRMGALRPREVLS